MFDVRIHSFMLGASLVTAKKPPALFDVRGYA
jgi:hypothetical protein